MRRGDILLERNEIVTSEALKDQNLVDDVRRDQRHKMLDDLMNLDGIPFREAMQRIELWEETRAGHIPLWAHHLPPDRQPQVLRLRVVVRKPE